MHVNIRGQLLELVLPFYPGGPGIDEASDLLSRGFYQFSPLSSQPILLEWDAVFFFPRTHCSDVKNDETGVSVVRPVML